MKELNISLKIRRIEGLFVNISDKNRLFHVLFCLCYCTIFIYYIVFLICAAGAVQGVPY
jgi:hypothetical protein